MARNEHRHESSSSSAASQHPVVAAIDGHLQRPQRHRPSGIAATTSSSFKFKNDSRASESRHESFVEVKALHSFKTREIALSALNFSLGHVGSLWFS